LTRAGLFVTGTDTGVGKTMVARALLQCARRRGLHPVPYKPVETGCDPEPEDARALWEAAGQPIPLAAVCPFPLRLPAAPLLAAQEQDLSIGLDDLVRRAGTAADGGDFLLVEGAGGLLVPYAPGATAADLAARLALPILIVARTALGTVNHTALTVREAARAGLRIAGVVLSRATADAGPQEHGNDALIAAACGVTPLGTLPYLDERRRRDVNAVADALTGSIGEQALARLLSV
jgi:dethiobiotin synthetase